MNHDYFYLKLQNEGNQHWIAEKNKVFLQLEYFGD